jgi:hypothetical protein
MGCWQLCSFGQRSLPCGLFGPIDIHHLPVVPLPIPQASRWEGLSRSHEQVVEKLRSQRFNCLLIKSC